MDSPKNYASRGGSQEVNSSRQRISNLVSENRGLKTRVRELEDEMVKLTAMHKRKLSQSPALYGAYCDSGATPYLLKVSMDKVGNALTNFIMYAIRAGSPRHSLSEAAAYVSSIFFAKFEREDFGVEDGAKFTPPDERPAQAFKEYKAFACFVDDQEDCSTEAAVKPYMRKFEHFLQLMVRDIRNSNLGQLIERAEESHVHFYILAMNVWILHKLTLSFDKTTVRLIRVGREDPFREGFMEAVNEQDAEQYKRKSPPTIEHLVLPGLWVNGSIVKCRVYLGLAHQEERHCLGPVETVGAVNGAEHSTDMDGVETTASEEQQHATAESNETHHVSNLHPHDRNHGLIELDMTEEASHSEPNIETPACFDATGITGNRRDTEDIKVAQEMMKSKTAENTPLGVFPKSAYPSKVLKNPPAPSTQDKHIKFRQKTPKM